MAGAEGMARDLLDVVGVKGAAAAAGVERDGEQRAEARASLSMALSARDVRGMSPLAYARARYGTASPVYQVRILR